MTPERWRRVKELFAAAAERDAASVPEFLAQACAGDTELVAEVESLLGAHRTESSVVDRPAAECLPAEFLSADEDRWTGRRIFRCAPLHHHFEFLGWPETRVTSRFWLLGTVLALSSLAVLRW